VGAVVTALRSQAYLAGSRGAPCTLRIPGVCRDERETVVPCHLRDSHTGRSIKASDLSVADGCSRCHDVFDRRVRLPNGLLLSDYDWLFYALRGLQATLERRKDMKLITVVGDAELQPRREPKPTPRKPKADGRPVPKGKPLESRLADWPTGRKIPSRAKERSPA
jgi:hypothetical protein